ncbi:calcium-binding protein [Actinoplanes sp. LDG1-06]|uniref:Calcium-binding protein n=1 Tax=Paractinoplanes ovalisporus TaxID=2810368 RepID=A0ABS2A4G8_9ACTN|nr:calcium-binding protein [Actinoplanes ovalisporus]MBM2614744.1 calcium-binding protein [Actinoplanes ovalisporus]
MRKRWIGLAAVAVFISATAVPAEAATAAGVAQVLSPYVVQYAAGQKAVNAVVVTRSGRTVTIDDRIPVRAGKGCAAVKGDSTKVRCTTSQTPNQVRVFTYDLNDTVINKSDLPLTANGGPGSDKLLGGPKNDFLQGDVFGQAGAGNDSIWGYGGVDFLIGAGGDDSINGGDGNDYIDIYLTGPGNPYNPIASYGHDKLYGSNGDDWLLGGAGNDLLSGGAGNDNLDGGTGDNTFYGGDGNDQMEATTGADKFFGGPGARDTAYYGTRARPVTVDMDGQTGDDGEAGEGDTVGSDVEWLYGGTGNDVLIGNASANYIFGGQGDDLIRGGAGNDELRDTQGSDKVYGEAGDDLIHVHEFEGQGFPDLADGGPNTDTCQADADDTVAACEVTD